MCYEQEFERTMQNDNNVIMIGPKNLLTLTVVLCLNIHAANKNWEGNKIKWGGWASIPDNLFGSSLLYDARILRTLCTFINKR